MAIQLYLHIPFCKSKCAYCDFCSATGTEAEMNAYGRLLEKEIRLIATQHPGTRLSTVFLGGGTPSLLPYKALEGILRAVTEEFVLEPGVEFTTEANPGTLTEAWLAVARRYGLNRLSLGMQAAQNKLLKSLGRIHRPEDVALGVELARQQGIQNINIDVMFGLAGQSLGEYLETLEMVHALGATHVSAYSLILEEGTPLFQKMKQGEILLPEEDEVAEMYARGSNWLGNHGYHQYEISNFAGPGYECRHNLGYWQGAWYMGLGLNAHSMLPAERGQEAAYMRCENTADMAAYRAMVEHGHLPRSEETFILPEEAMFETMMLGLRTTDGVGLKDFTRRHGRDMAEMYGPRLEGLMRDGLAFWREDRQKGRCFALTKRGLILQNSVLLRLMD